MNITNHLLLATIMLSTLTLLSSCGNSGNVANNPEANLSPEEAVLEIISSSQANLAAAKADDKLADVAKEIVSQLDNYEDSIHGAAAKPFEQFHVQVDQLPRLVDGADEAAIEEQLTKLQSLAEEYIKQSQVGK